MKEFTTTQVQKILHDEKGEYTVVDVRESEEVAAGKIPEAINIPLGEIPTKISEFEKDKKYILVCRSGARSFNATQFLESYGFDVTNMSGGMIQWQGSVITEREVI